MATKKQDVKAAKALNTKTTSQPTGKRKTTMQAEKNVHKPAKQALAAAVNAEDSITDTPAVPEQESPDIWLKDLENSVHFFSADKQEAAAEAVKAIALVELDPAQMAEACAPLRILLTDEAELLATRVNKLCSKLQQWYEHATAPTLDAA